MKYLCLDLGVAHTGLAISEEGELATPLATIFEKDLDSLIGKLTPYLARINPDCLVIGSPSHGILVDYSKLLSEKIKTIFSGEVVIHNEDLSSKKAQSTLGRSIKSHKQKKQVEHQTAAAHILQDFLDNQ